MSQNSILSDLTLIPNEGIDKPKDIASDYRCLHAFSHTVNHGPYTAERCPKCANLSWTLK